MPDTLLNLIADVLDKPRDAVMYRLSRGLSEQFPGRYVLESGHWAFVVEEYAREGLCEVQPIPDTHSQFDTEPLDGYQSAQLESYNSWLSVQWQGQTLQLVSVGLMGSHCRDIRRFLIADTREIAESFFLAVCEWNAEVRGEVLVYTGGWAKDAELFKAIKGSTLDNLVLEEGLKELIREDFATFFESRATYEKYGIPWKRGVLLLGPPGNGKTHCIKALVNYLGIPCLYVRTFERDYGTQQGAIAEVFARARQTAPCVLVFEDLDSLLNDQNRSFFLNELDGFAANAGLMVVGTTNHPENLDPAILDRPSRFDRKYTFHLPDADCRAKYLQVFSAGLEPQLRLDEPAARRISELSEGFSFAYLRELYLSAMMAWVHGVNRPIVEVIQDLVEPLRSQMQTEPADADAVGEASEPFANLQQYRAQWLRAMKRR